jgi:hypothetical protein
VTAKLCVLSKFYWRNLASGCDEFVLSFSIITCMYGHSRLLKGPIPQTFNSNLCVLEFDSLSTKQICILVYARICGCVCVLLLLLLYVIY